MLVLKKIFIILITLLSLIHLSILRGNEDKIESINIEFINADKVSNDKRGNLILEGNVSITTNLLEFKADKALYNKLDESLLIENNVKIISSNLKIDADSVTANLLERSFSVKDSNLNFKNTSFGSTQDLKIKTSGDVILIDSNLTNCSEDDPIWEITAKKIEILKNQRNAIIKGIKLNIKNIPIFYFPYVRTSVGNERLSGFLSPSLRQGGDGIDISLPYYFNLAPNYDLVFSPRHITDRGSGGALEFRYVSESSRGKLGIATLLSDKEYKREVGQGSKRWKTTWTHKTNIRNALFTEINFKSASDEYFFRDIGDGQFGESKTSYLPKNLSMLWKTSYFDMELELNRFQILNPFVSEEYKVQPKLNFNSFLYKKNFSYHIASSIGTYEREGNKLFFSKFNEVDRAYLGQELRYLINLDSSTFSFSLGSDITKYNTNHGNFTRSSPWFEAEYRVFLEKNIHGVQKTLTPTIKYVYVKEEEESHLPLIDSRIFSTDYEGLFRRNIYSGFDRNPKADKLIIGIEHISSFSRNKTTLFSLGKALYLERLNSLYTLEEIDKSPLVGEVTSYINKNSRYSLLLEWDGKTKKINSGSFGFIYDDKQKRRFELRSVYRRKNLNPSYVPWLDNLSATNQVEAIAHFPITKSFSIFGRLQKDIDRSKSVDILMGFEYANCCLKFGIMNRKWIVEDYFAWKSKYESPYLALYNGHEPSRLRDNLYLFIELKELGRLGKKVSKIISSQKLE